MQPIKVLGQQGKGKERKRIWSDMIWRRAEMGAEQWGRWKKLEEEKMTASEVF